MNNSPTRYIAVFLFFLLFSAHQAAGKEYSIPELKIEAEVLPDGSVRITEYRTYVFDGTFTWANYQIPKSGFSGISDISLAEGSSPLVNLNSEEPGTFLVEESDNAFNIKWFYQAEDEERIFTISYTLTGAITIGPEWSEFFWIFAASNREKSTDHISVQISFRESVTPSRLHAWVREPRSKLTDNYTQNGFYFEGEDISREEAVTIRTVFPTSVFSRQEVSVTDNNFSLTWAQNDEQEFREKEQQWALEQARLFETGKQLAALIIVLSIVITIFFYRRYGKRYKINTSYGRNLNIPGDEKPAAIGWLLTGRSSTASHLLATLLDLARRDYFVIKEKEREKKKWSSFKGPLYETERTDKKSGRDLTDWELSLIEFVEARIQDDKTTLDKIFAQDSTQAVKWQTNWYKKVNAYCKNQGWIDQGSYKGFVWNIALQAILVIASIAGIFVLNPVLAIAAGVSTVCLFFSFAIIRRTQKGEEIYRKWKAYKHALYNTKDFPISRDLLGKHFVFSVAFGMNKKSIEQLFASNPEAIAYIYWFVILPGSTSTPADMASSFASLAATGTSSASGGSFSGGASAGSAGGGASGGAG